MKGFLLLPSGKIINTALVFLVSPEVSGRVYAGEADFFGRYVCVASATGQAPDHILGDLWLDKPDADVLVAALVPADWTTR